MWEQKLFELFVNIIPQGFAFVLLYFALTDIRIKTKLFIGTSLAYAIAAFVIRPYVNFGVHSIILLFILVFIAVKWGRVKLLKAVLYGIVPFIVGYICEWILFIFLLKSGIGLDLLKTDARVRTILGFIPLGMIFAVSFTVYFMKRHLGNKRGDDNAGV
jgi:hypothetical protein